MKRLLFISLLSTLFASASNFYTQASKYYKAPNFESKIIGIELTASSVTGDTGDHGVNYTGHSMSGGLRLGAQNNAWRSMFLFDFQSSGDHGQDYQRGLVQFDYFIDTPMLLKYATRPYIGINGGIVNYDASGVGGTGFTMGAEVGATVSLTQSIEADLGYRYNIALPDELDSIGGLVMGLHYKF